MTGRVALGLFVLAAVIGCSRAPGPATPHSIYVSTLTINEVRQRALAALEKPDMTFHTTESAKWNSRPIEEYKREVWLDSEHNLARTEQTTNGKLVEDGGLQIYHDGYVASVFDGRFGDAIISPLPDGVTKASVLALHYISTLFRSDIKSAELKSATVDGAPAILVEIVAPGGDGAPDETTSIFLDEQFLILRIKTRGPIRSQESTVEVDFLPSASLPLDFFSVDDVRAFVKTGADRMQEAIEAGFHPYWLGESYNDLPLYDTLIIDSTDKGRGKALAISYETIAQADPDAPHYGLNLLEYSPEDWARRADRLATPTVPVEEIAVSIDRGRAVVYSGFGVLHLVVTFDDTVLEVSANIGLSNPYASVEGLSAVARALSRFEL